MCTTNGQDHAGRLSHQACVYAGTAELERGICRFVEEGLAGGEPALVVAPGERLQAVEAGLGAASEKVRLQDMTVHGLNPARIIPILLDWTERSGSPVRAVSEPLWPGRGDAEVVEVLRHEALVEAALGAAQAKLLCAYLQDALTGSARASLERSHHTVRRAAGSVPHRAGKPRA